ncbi:MAG: DUF4143 domain-containing protein [Treponema sp.]|nr:DUF4143 domain-containing protein [Treponema sp.]
MTRRVNGAVFHLRRIAFCAVFLLAVSLEMPCKADGATSNDTGVSLDSVLQLVQKAKPVPEDELVCELSPDGKSVIIKGVNKNFNKPAVPLKSYVSFTEFKLFMNDIGLLGALSELDKESVLDGNDIFVEFKGALTEQYVLQELVATTSYSLYYYSGEKSTFETDFLFQKGKNVIPIEVKAEENLKSKSLRAYCDKFKPACAVRTSMSGYREQEWMTNVPLWCISCV